MSTKLHSIRGDSFSPEREGHRQIDEWMDGFISVVARLDMYACCIEKSRAVMPDVPEFQAFRKNKQ